MHCGQELLYHRCGPRRGTNEYQVCSRYDDGHAWMGAYYSRGETLAGIIQASESGVVILPL